MALEIEPSRWAEGGHHELCGWEGDCGQGRGQGGTGLAGRMHRCSCGDGEDRGAASQAPWRVGAPPFMAVSPREMCLHQEGVWGLPGFPLTQKEAETFP